MINKKLGDLVIGATYSKLEAKERLSKLKKRENKSNTSKVEMSDLIDVLNSEKKTIAVVILFYYILNLKIERKNEGNTDKDIGKYTITLKCV